MPDTTQPKPHVTHELDILVVANPDVNCDFVDPETGYSHKDYFEVKWSGQPHRIQPGKTKRMPRFLAQHFAKHLADHMLIMMEEKTGRKGLLQSPVERPRVLKQILVEVEEYHLMEPEKEEGQKVSAMVDLLNPSPQPEKQPEEPATNVGDMPIPMVGKLKPEPKPLSEIMKAAGEAGPTKEELSPTPPATPNPPAGSGQPPADAKNFPSETFQETSIYDPSKPKPTKRQLLIECDKMGIEVTGKETVDQLISKIKAF